MSQSISVILAQGLPFCLRRQRSIIFGELLTEEVTHVLAYPVPTIGSNSVAHFQIRRSNKFGNHAEREPRVTVIAMSFFTFTCRAEINGNRRIVKNPYGS